MWLAVLLIFCLQINDVSPGPTGSLTGVVINQTRGCAVGPGTEVVLRVEVDGQFVAVTETSTDRQGLFRFEDLPVLAEAVYLPGANRGEVHYPGPRVQLSPDLPHAEVKLQVFDEASSPNPLVIRRHEITIDVATDALRVTESLQVENPSPVCYVGGGESSATPPITLRLEIPQNFERATFQSEFFGRRFSWQDNALVTRIPWPPGRRELKFSYVMANAKGSRSWQRTIDLPSDVVQLTVHSQEPTLISCDPLPRTTLGDGMVTFTSSESLPAGGIILLRLDGLPVPLVVYLRWISVVTLISLLATVGAWLMRGRAAMPPPENVAMKLSAHRKAAAKSCQSSGSGRSPAGRS